MIKLTPRLTVLPCHTARCLATQCINEIHQTAHRPATWRGSPRLNASQHSASHRFVHKFSDVPPLIASRHSATLRGATSRNTSQRGATPRNVISYDPKMKFRIERIRRGRIEFDTWKSFRDAPTKELAIQIVSKMLDLGVDPGRIRIIEIPDAEDG